MTILISIHLWKRPDITRVMFKGLRRIIDTAPPDVDVLPWVCYSRDKDVEHIPPWVFRSIYAENYPLGRKHNTSLSYSLQYDWDYFMQLGSDDLLATDFWAHVEPHLRKRRKFFGFQNIYFACVRTGAMKVYRNLQVFGAGRFIRRDILERAATVRQHRFTRPYRTAKGWHNQGDTTLLSYAKEYDYAKPIGWPLVRLWDNDRKRGLDTNSERNMVDRLDRGEGIPISVKAWRPVVLDLKGSTNLNPYRQLPGTDIDDMERAAVYGLFPEVVELIPMHKTVRV